MKLYCKIANGSITLYRGEFEKDVLATFACDGISHVQRRGTYSIEVHFKNGSSPLELTVTQKASELILWWFSLALQGRDGNYCQDTPSEDDPKSPMQHLFDKDDKTTWPADGSLILVFQDDGMKPCVFFDDNGARFVSRFSEDNVLIDTLANENVSSWIPCPDIFLGVFKRELYK